MPSTAGHASHTEHLGDAIAELAARLHAATYELLVLLRQFDEACGWNNGFRSCAHWLHWRTGIDLGAAREKVRVAKALAVLPQLSAVMQRGEVSYAKVRAITRVATPDNEAQVVDVARCGTAAHVERVMRAWRRVDRMEAARVTEARHLDRHLTTWVDDDGMVVLRGRLTPEVTAGQRRADALGPLAECALAADLDRGTAGDRYQVVLHVEAERAHDDDAYASAETCRNVARESSPSAEDRPWTERKAAPDESARPSQHPVLEVGDGTMYVSAETSPERGAAASRDGTVWKRRFTRANRGSSGRRRRRHQPLHRDSDVGRPSTRRGLGDRRASLEAGVGARFRAGMNTTRDQRGLRSAVRHDRETGTLAHRHERDA